MEILRNNKLTRNYGFFRFKELGNLESIDKEDVKVGDVISEMDYRGIRYYLILDISINKFSKPFVTVKNFFEYLDYKGCEIYPGFINLVFNK